MTEQTLVFPGYILHEKLGEGGFATVYLATQVSLQRKVALKVMSSELSREAEFCERFIREGRDMAELSNHPDIVTVFDIDRVNEHYFISMQYLPGPTLKQLLRSTEPYPHPLHIVRRVAGALAYAHSKGFVHRDVKPANILFNESGEAVLSDFGIAKARQRDKDLTQVGAIIGTATYMSPEQAQQSAVVDGRSDLYSLGVMLFELLTREVPYKHSFRNPAMLQHVNSPVPTLPPSEQIYQPLIDRLMAKDPDDRYATGNEFIDDIDRRYMNDQPAVAGHRPVFIKPSSLQGKIALTAAALLALGVILSGWILFKPIPNQQMADALPLSESEQEKLIRLIETAKVHELVGRIDDPPGSNAIEAYQMVLEIDPSHQAALASLARLRSQ